MDGPLVDSEGFPRSDIDVYSCRHARNKISCLQNDHIALMNEIEEELNKLHLAAKASKMSLSDTKIDTQSEAALAMETERLPFAELDRVDQGSPGADGGLQVGDKVIEFGSVMAENFTDIKTFGSIVQHSINKPVRVIVLRNGHQLPLNITPSKWRGPGVLGCNIKPLR